MRKKIILVILMMMPVAVFFGQKVTAVTEEQATEVREHCDVVKDNLRDLQRRDSRARANLGRYYEAILNRFITPLNMRLVENNLSGTNFISNQNELNRTWADFKVDYVEYQKSLEELVGMNCKSEPDRFYKQLVTVREKRATVASDAKYLRKLASKHVELVMELEVKL